MKRSSAGTQTNMPAYEIKLEHLCEVEAYVTAPIAVGPSSWGIRLVLPVVSGTAKGAKLNGKVVGPAGDWGLIRTDNCFELDVRAVIETDDGAFVYAYYRGVVDMTQDQVEQFLAGNVPEGLVLYVTPRFETSHEKYQWLNRIQAVGRGTVEPAGDKVRVTYSWYVLS